MTLVFKIVGRAQWTEAERAGEFAGAEIDLRDGYIHLSSAEQTPQTAALHFAGRDDLVLVALEAEALGAALKWEPSRGGQLFPHLYAALPMRRVLWAKPFSARAPETLRALLSPL